MTDTIRQEAVGTARVGIAGTDTSGMRAICSIAQTSEASRPAGFGMAGIDRAEKHRVASFGVAGVKDASTARASAGVAGNLNEHNLPALLKSSRHTGRQRLGDRAAAEGWEHGVYFSDFSYIACTSRVGGLRWRNRREHMFGKQHRRMPLFLDSAAYRRFTGSAPRWVTFETYLQSIDLLQPEGFAAYDVIGDQVTSRTNFDAMI